MKKDVIYVDIEDDITSIIEKVKAASASIVALVPPKRIGVLQSVVNLKLLQRAASSADKRVVLITNDAALSGLAAGVAMPVAKNLQSKPEIPEITALEVDDEDIINGDELPVGDLAQTAPLSPSTAPSSIESALPKVVAPTTVPAAAAAAKNAPKKGGPRVPNFELFRKKALLIACGAVLFIAFLIWAIFFAPHATVTITAKTNIANIDQELSLVPNGTLDATQKVLPALVEQTKKTNSVDFDATGKKNVGDKATATVNFSNGNTGKVTITAGTQLASPSGLVFTLNSNVEVPAGTVSCPTIFSCTGVPGKSTGSVTAIEGGAKYNGATGNLTGAPSGITASFGSTAAGGTDKTATVVTQADIDKAKEQFASQDAEKIKNELKKQFDGDVLIISESFKAEPASPVSSPALDQEATRAKLTAETTYTLVAIKRSDLKSVFNTYLKSQINADEQRIYADGDEDVNFSEFESAADGKYLVKAQADAQVGPKIDDAVLKPQLAGKRSGEIQQLVEGIQGVENVETKFSPFWVTKAPDAKKITIKFVLKNDTN